MDLNVERLKEVLKSVGCDSKVSGTEMYVLMPDNFPWYGGNDKHETENSRIIATVTLSWGDWKWTDAWPMPLIRTWDDEPLGVEMRKGPPGTSNGALNELNDFNYDEIANWLQNKIGEISKMTKEYRRKLLEYQMKDYEV